MIFFPFKAINFLVWKHCLLLSLKLSKNVIMKKITDFPSPIMPKERCLLYMTEDGHIFIACKMLSLVMITTSPVHRIIHTFFFIDKNLHDCYKKKMLDIDNEWAWQ